MPWQAIFTGSAAVAHSVTSTLASYLSVAQNGHKVRSVSELQDIDELCVVEVSHAMVPVLQQASVRLLQDAHTAALVWWSAYTSCQR